MTDDRRLASSVELVPPGMPGESTLNEVFNTTQVIQMYTDENADAAFMFKQRGFNTVAFMGGLMTISQIPVA